MALQTQDKSKIIEKNSRHEKDTGSSEVQIALFTEEIERLAKHLKKNPKDNSSRRGLLKMVSKRKKLMDFLKSKLAKKTDNSKKPPEVKK